MDNEPFPIRSGVSRQYRRAFLLEEDSLRRIEGKLLKAKEDLAEETKAVFHVKREDDRFYETFNIEDVFQDPNLPTKRVSYVAVELRKRRDATDSAPWNGDWVARVAFIRERKYGGFRDWNEITTQVSTADRKWALLLADELEPQVQRTLKTGVAGYWYLFILVFLLLVIVPGAFEHFFSGTKTGEILRSPNLYGKGLALGGGVVLAVWFLLRMEPLTPKFLLALLGQNSTFLWGEELKLYPRREQLRRNLFWVILVGFIVSFAGSIASLFYTK